MVGKRDWHRALALASRDVNGLELILRIAEIGEEPLHPLQCVDAALMPAGRPSLVVRLERQIVHGGRVGADIPAFGDRRDPVREFRPARRPGLLNLRDARRGGRSRFRRRLLSSRLLGRSRLRARRTL